MRIPFDRSEPGAWISGAAHGAILLAAVFGLSTSKLPDAEEGIPVEVVTDNQFSEMTKGEREAAKPLPEPKPRADRVAETRVERDPGEEKVDAPAPPKRPAEVKVAEEEAEAAPPPPPAPKRVAEAANPQPAPAPPSRPEPPKPDPKVEAQKAAEAKAKAEAAAKAVEAQKLAERQEAEALEKARVEAAKAKALAEAKAKAEAEAKARAVAEAKAKAELEAKLKALAEAEAREKAEAEAKAKALAQAKAKAEAEARARRQAEAADKFSPGDIRQLLASKEPSRSSGATGREVQRTASLGTATGSSQRLNPSQRDQLIGLLSEQLHRCWQVPVAAQSVDKPPVPTVRVKLNQDGSLAAEPVVMNSSGDPLFRSIADSATRATRRCAPLKIPAQFAPFYNDWRDLVVNFDPRQVG
ncbi:cell envelope integrity protein TolA [Enterovirga aerilata]|uniref:Cell envelope integrity protein TolA n=1 Tax=Enterovirga aerilata TaxID=2730920 RepID=A0A849IDK4_9HYPH|nr:cell envelope integrity protein TolA [Enterovirga sp. DB1703]